MKYSWQCGLALWTTVWDDRLLCLQSRLAKGTIACETRFGVASECFVSAQVPPLAAVAARASAGGWCPHRGRASPCAQPAGVGGATERCRCPPAGTVGGPSKTTPLFAPRSALASTTVAAGNTRWKHVPVTLRCMSHESLTLRRLRLLRARPWCRVRRPSPRCRAMLSCWRPRCASTLRAAARN